MIGYQSVLLPLFLNNIVVYFLGFFFDFFLDFVNKTFDIVACLFSCRAELHLHLSFFVGAVTQSDTDRKTDEIGICKLDACCFLSVIIKNFYSRIDKLFIDLFTYSIVFKDRNKMY